MIDLTASLPGLKSSLTPLASEFSGVTSRLRLREADRVASKMFGLGMGFIAGAVLLGVYYIVRYA